MSWERAGLISPQEQYSFEELGQLRALRDLQAHAAKTRTRIATVAAHDVDPDRLRSIASLHKRER